MFIDREGKPVSHSFRSAMLLLCLHPKEVKRACIPLSRIQHRTPKGVHYTHLPLDL